jgi:hypothetical protein
VAQYRITIEKADTNDTGQVTGWRETTKIEASSVWKLDMSIAEWVREEIDPGAEIVTEGNGDAANS